MTVQMKDRSRSGVSLRGSHISYLIEVFSLFYSLLHSFFIKVRGTKTGCDLAWSGLDLEKRRRS